MLIVTWWEVRSVCAFIELFCTLQGREVQFTTLFAWVDIQVGHYLNGVKRKLTGSVIRETCVALMITLSVFIDLGFVYLSLDVILEQLCLFWVDSQLKLCSVMVDTDTKLLLSPMDYPPVNIEDEARRGGGGLVWSMGRGRGVPVYWIIINRI